MTLPHTLLYWQLMGTMIFGKDDLHHLKLVFHKLELISVVLHPGRWTLLWRISCIEVGNSIPHPFSTLWCYAFIEQVVVYIGYHLCKAMSRCSVDGQVSRLFSHGIIGERCVFAAATCTDSIVAKTRRRAAIIVEVAVHVCLDIVCKLQQILWLMESRQII